MRLHLTEVAFQKIIFGVVFFRSRKRSAVVLTEYWRLRAIRIERKAVMLQLGGINQKEVPAFFRFKWAKNHNDEDPLVNESRYCERYQKYIHTMVFWVSLMLLSAVVDVVGAIVIRQGGPAYFLIISSMLTPVFIGVSYRSYRHSPDRCRAKWHFQRYYTQLGKLFQLFEIEPSHKLKELNETQFRVLIADSLVVQRELILKTKGFSRFRHLVKFERMHASAHEWELCDRRSQELADGKE